MVQVLEQLYPKYQASMSRADFWAAAATMAAEECSKTGPTELFMPLFFGREDAAMCTGFTPAKPEGVFPDSDRGLNSTLTYFANVFNMTTKETVIIIGAHTLGMASPNGSGYEGRWTVAPDTLDNSFYSDLTLQTMFWEQEQPVRPDNWQWTAGTGQLMLNSDMALYKSIFDGAATDAGAATCTYDTCASSETAQLVDEYAANNALWVQDFSVVFAKMLTKGYDACSLAVMPSMGSGPQAEAQHNVTGVQQQCGVVTAAPIASPGTVVGGPGEPAVVVGAAGGPAATVGAPGEPAAVVGAAGGPAATVGGAGEPATSIGAAGTQPVQQGSDAMLVERSTQPLGSGDSNTLRGAMSLMLGCAMLAALLA